MIEIIKNWILALLVGLSLLLSGMLWYSIPNYAPLLNALNINQLPTTDSTEYKIDDIVRPREITVYSDEGKEYVLYSNDDDFKTTYQMIKQITISNLRELEESDEGAEDAVEAEEDSKQPVGIELAFYSAMPVEYLAIVFSLDENDLRNLEGTFQRVSLYYDDQADRVVWEFQGERSYVGSADISKNRLLEECSNIVQDYEMPSFAVSNFENVPIRLVELSNSLFSDPTAIRQIQEKDQSVIYTDGSRGLRLNSLQQTIDYTDPTIDNRYQETNVLKMIEEAIEFLNRHQSWAGDYVLVEISRESSDNDEYTLVFQQQYEGMPILSTRNLNNSEIRIKMKNNKVTRMNRSMMYLKASGDANTTRGVLTKEQIRAIVERRMDIDDQNHTIYLAYYPYLSGSESVQLRLVWIVQKKSSILSIFDAETGQEIQRVGG